MTRLIIASDEYAPSFSDIVAYLQQELPSIHEHEITLVVPDFKGEHLPIGEAHIVRLPKGVFGYKTSVVRELVEQHDKAIIHTTGPIAKAVVRECSEQDKEIEFYVHRSRYDPLYNKADTVYVPTSQAKEVLIQQGLIKRVEVQPYDIDMNFFSPVEEKESAKEVLSILPEEFVVGVVGPIPQYVLESFAVLKETNPHIKLLVLGHKEQYVDRDIMYYSPQHSLEKYFQALDVFISPMSYLSLLAMSCELVVVTDATGMFSHLVHDKITVLTYPQENSTVLRLKLQWVINEAEQRERIAFKARGVIQKFLGQ